MAFVNSIAGRAAGRLWSNPVAGAAVTFGLGAGTFAGASTFLTTKGSAGDKADAGASSAIKYAAAGTAGVYGLATATGVSGAFRAGLEGYEGPLAESVAYGTARNARSAVEAVQGRSARYARGLVNEFSSPGGWKTALERPAISGGLGAITGAVIGSHISDDPNKGAVTGGAVGLGLGIAAGRVSNASRTWSKWGSVSRGGTVLAASAVIGGALALMSGNDGPADVASPDDYGQPPAQSGVRDRMSRVNASGDLVFGLHRSR